VSGRWVARFVAAGRVDIPDGDLCAWREDLRRRGLNVGLKNVVVVALPDGAVEGGRDRGGVVPWALDVQGLAIAAERDRAALEWSGQAGLTLDADAVRRALAAHHVEAEDTLDELVAALGVPTG
jgi:hypothetical protein